MTISGFTMVRNATKLHYPVKQAILSILPVVDEFIVAVGDCDADDHTIEEIQSIESDKIKIIYTTWDLIKYPRGMEHAHQTDIAKNACKGDWLFYIQSDEVVHEKYLPVIWKRCFELNDNDTVEGLLFNYRHFWGDYDHYIVSHTWYNREIRIVRNRKDIHSWESAQSFRRIPGFEGINYRQKEGTYKLKVARVNAYIYHYGWVRSPVFMQKKRKAFTTIHQGKEQAEAIFKYENEYFDYGDLSKLPKHKQSHPAVIKELIEKFDWADQLQTIRKKGSFYKHQHDKLKYRLLTFIEQNILKGRQILTFKNYILSNH
jgi:hypothetical protein